MIMVSSSKLPFTYGNRLVQGQRLGTFVSYPARFLKLLSLNGVLSFECDG